MHVIRSLVFYLVFYGGSVLHVLAAFVAIYLFPSRLRAICDSWGSLHFWCVMHILGLRLEITGHQPSGPAFFAIKHEAAFEAIDLPNRYDFPAAFAKKELFDIPGWGRAGRTYGLIPVYRDEGAKALRNMLKEARPRIAEGRPIVIFPEGKRVKHGERPKLQAGFAALYKLLGLPVIPVAVDSGKSYATLWKRPGVIRMHFGEPIPPGLPREEVEARTHAAINIFNNPPAG